MIGLGSNRLTVCRRGGMSVTQAGRGGMEWLGSRGPSWASPYSAQATAALKAQFPTQWPTIRDYGFAHPEIVGYMNAYAPEDAKIAYALVPTLGYIRNLICGASSTISTGIVSNTLTVLKATVTFTSSSGWRHIGDATHGDNDDWRLFDLNGTLYWDCGSARIIRSLALNTKATIEIGNNYTIVNGTRNSGTTQTNIYANDILIAGDGALTLHGNMEIFDGTAWHTFVAAKHNGKSGLVDLADGSFHEPTGTGATTISETPAS